jgi:hypothetical protein
MITTEVLDELKAKIPSILIEDMSIASSDAGYFYIYRGYKSVTVLIADGTAVVLFMDDRMVEVGRPSALVRLFLGYFGQLSVHDLLFALG